MEFYQELTIIENPEININHLWSKIYQQVHLALVEHAAGEVAVSFPEYDKEKGIGKKLRLISKSSEKLAELNLEKYLCHCNDYFQLTRVRPIPEKKIKGYAIYRRKRSEQGSISKAKRYAKRHNISIDEALAIYLPKTAKHTLPYITLQSLSTKSNFPLYIEKKIVAEAVDGDYGSYGLSLSATVPLF